MLRKFHLVLSAGSKLHFQELDQLQTQRVESDVFRALNLQAALELLNQLRADQSLVFLSPISDFRVTASSLDLLDQLRVGAEGFRGIVFRKNDHFDLVCCDSARNYFRLSKVAGADDAHLIPLPLFTPLEQCGDTLQTGISVTPTAHRDQIELRLAPLFELRIEKGLSGLGDIMLQMGENKGGFATLTLNTTEECQICFSPDGRKYLRLTKERGKDTFEVRLTNTPLPVRLADRELQLGLFVTPPVEGKIEVHITPACELRNPRPFTLDSHLGGEKKSLILVWRIDEEASCTFSPDEQQYFFLQKLAGQATVTIVSALPPIDEDDFDVPTNP